MKPRLTSILLALIAIPATTFTASADVIGNGVVYDVGKNHYADKPSGQGYIEDDMQCWAAAGSNAVQYWQDTYYEKHDDKEVPNGVIENSPYAPPAGTRYLRVYEKELEYMIGNWGGESVNFFNWWMNGTEVSGNLKTGKGAYYSDVFGDKAAGLAYKGLDDQWGAQFFYEGEPVPVFTPEGLDQMHKDLTDFIVDTFQTQGQIATLNINYGHAITCLGYETDENGLLSALILTNSDDAHFGAFRASIVREQTDPLSMAAMGWEDMYQTYGERLVLKTDDDEVLRLNATYGTDSPTVKPWVSGAARIDTPEEIAVDATPAQSTVTAGETLAVNTRLMESQTVAGNGIVVGNGEQAMILTSAKTTGDGEAVILSLDGETATGNHTGMTLQEGSMVSLYSLTVQNYAEGGIYNGTKMYLHDGTQNISNNTKEGNGAGISNQNFIELQDNASVSITNNKSTGDDGKGGGIFNAENATVSIHGNGEVTFSGNSADCGNDIYNSATGIVNIADNIAVTFVGDSKKTAEQNISIVNEGDLYLAAGDGKHITFENSSLETTGKTYIGRDKSNWSTDTAGDVAFTDTNGSRINISSNSADTMTYATLEKLSVSANAIAGAGDETGSISNALITSLGGLSVGKLKLDTTDSLVSQGPDYINLDNVVLTLTDSDMEGNTFDLTNVLTGNLTLNKVVFDLSQVTLQGDDLSKLTFDLSKAYADTAALNEQLSFKTAQGKVSLVQAGSTVLLAAAPLPEPTTGTLSLVALVALAARRRKK